MQIDEKQIFMFRTMINGTNFEFGRVGTSRQEAATTLADDLEKVVSELHEIAKSNLKSN